MMSGKVFADLYNGIRSYADYGLDLNEDAVTKSIIETKVTDKGRTYEAATMKGSADGTIRAEVMVKRDGIPA
ncbi:MAG: hypothetical protein EOP84_03730 [Verrucomicrobiaceae bacterium]|nr:MAG: hypothetical protein EOP84_03730 [Verrucomicrobiaceae bacterium]